MQSETTRERNDTNTPANARQAIDSTVAELAEKTGPDHRELADALLEARDTLLVNGRVPEWFGDGEAGPYGEAASD